MSLESKIEALTAAVVELTAKLNAAPVAAVPPTPAAPTPSAPVPAPVVSAAPAPAAASPSSMPPPPTFQAPAAAAPAAVPFNDGKGLIDYVMSSYKVLGPQKGAQMQGVLTGLGYQNINEVKPEHYAALYAGIEALKA